MNAAAASPAASPAASAAAHCRVGGDSWERAVAMAVGLHEWEARLDGIKVNEVYCEA